MAGPSSAPGANIKRLESYEDTLEPGGVDDRQSSLLSTSIVPSSFADMFRRDQIMFDERESDDDDINMDQGQEVFGLNVQRKSRSQNDDEYDQEDDEEDEGDEEASEERPRRKSDSKEKKRSQLLTGRFAKAVSDDEDEDDEQGEESGSDDEAWGRQYYSRPSNRREKEGEEYDEQREEEREMEVKEVKRLPRKARETMFSADDWGLEDREVPEE